MLLSLVYSWMWVRDGVCSFLGGLSVSVCSFPAFWWAGVCSAVRNLTSWEKWTVILLLARFVMVAIDRGRELDAWGWMGEVYRPLNVLGLMGVLKAIRWWFL